MEMPFDDPPMPQPALAGVSGDGVELVEIAEVELVGVGVMRERRNPVLRAVMSLMEAWPETSGPFFTTDGQSATHHAQNLPRE